MSQSGPIAWPSTYHYQVIDLSVRGHPFITLPFFVPHLIPLKLDFPQQHPFFSTILYRVPPQLNLFLGVDTGGEAVSLIC